MFVWLSASDISIRVQLFRICVSFPLMSLMGGMDNFRFMAIDFLSIWHVQRHSGKDAVIR